MKGIKVRSYWSATGKLLLCFILVSTLILEHVPFASASGDHVQVCVAGGGEHSLALKSDGTVWAWGENADGQLGDGSSANRNTPVQVKDLTEVKAIAAGYTHSLALKEDGTVWSWGWNGSGQLGDGSTTMRKTPVKVQNLSEVKAIAAGFNYSLALKEDGTVWAWGRNTEGQLGDGSTEDRHTPVQVQNLSEVQAIVAGQLHNLTLKRDGTVWAWGQNTSGQLGDGSEEDRHTPVQVQNLTEVKAIATGSSHSHALKSDGTVWSWGWNLFGQLGDGSTTSSNTPVQVQNLTEVQAIAAGKNHSLAIKKNGSVWAWGYNDYGQLGDGSTTDRHIPVQLQNLAEVQAIAAGEKHSLAITDTGAFWSWGRNDYGQLGDGSNINRNAPVPVLNLISSNAYLSSLTLSAGTLSPAFFKNIYKYKAGSVSAATGSLTVTPTAEHPRATIQVSINGATEHQVASGSSSPPLALRIGLNEIRIEVLAEDNSTQQTYTVQITRQASPEAAADLSDMRLGGGAALNEPFDPNRLDYTVDVPHRTESLTVRPTAVEPTAVITVSVNGGTAYPVASGTDSPPLLLNIGENTLAIHVQIQDQSQEKTYRLTVNRSLSSNADLSDLQVSPGNLDSTFDAKKTVYKVEHTGNVGTLYIQATLADSAATLLINGQIAINGEQQAVSLQQGANLIPIVVTAADGMNQKTYVLSVNGTVSNADLTSLSVDSGAYTLDPVFATDHLHYTVYVDNDTEVVSIQANADDEKAFVLINGKVLPRNDVEQVSLQVGDNPITILVIAQNGSTKAYTVTIKREAARQAALGGLSLYAGQDELALDPEFDSTKTSYVASVANGIEQVQVTAIPLHPQAKLEVRVRYGSGNEIYLPLIHGERSQPLTLQVGHNFIDIRVLAEDETTEQVYTITVMRGQSSNAELSSINLSEGAKLNEVFQSTRSIPLMFLTVRAVYL